MARRSRLENMITYTNGRCVTLGILFLMRATSCFVEVSDGNVPDMELAEHTERI